MDEWEQEWLAEEQRHTAAFADIVRRYPGRRLSMAYALLGGAIATADMMGADAEGFLRQLREEHPKPAPLVPPEVKRGS